MDIYEEKSLWAVEHQENLDTHVLQALLVVRNLAKS